MSSLALLPTRDFAVFERQFLLEHYTERANAFNFISSLTSWSQFLSNMFPSARKIVCKNLNNDVSKYPNDELALNLKRSILFHH